ncbi:MAG: hypothetical protein JWO95_1544 [Verrucomicrobiales bacterium]|nr:hypothetical protein [Verrucomicrobiales bacterium]
MPNTALSLSQEVSPRVRGLFIKNLGDFQTELARVLAGFLPSLVVWQQRKELPALTFRSLRRVQDLRQRGRELGVSFEEMHFSGAVAGRGLIEKLCSAPNTGDLFQAGMVIIHSALIKGIEDYLKRNDDVYDLPSVALLEADRDELKAQIAWAQNALQQLAAEQCSIPSEEFIGAISEACADLPKILSEHNVRSATPIKTGRRIGVLPFNDAKLPSGFRHLEFGPEGLAKAADYAARSRYHASNFLQEVQAADSCASMLFEAPDMPWDFYLDLSRHTWDEARHAMFGEAKLAELGTSAAEAGLSTKAYAMRQTLTPLDRYAALSTQEADAFPGKHIGLKDSVAHKDALSAKAWSYDIADETQHLRFGTKWIPVMIEMVGEPRSYEQVKVDACNWRESVLAEVYKPAAATFEKGKK